MAASGWSGRIWFFARTGGSRPAGSQAAQREIELDHPVEGTWSQIAADLPEPLVRFLACFDGIGQITVKEKVIDAVLARLPDAPPGIEPIALSLEVQNGRVETATMVPTAVMGVFVELYKLQTRAPMDADDAGGDEPAPKPKRGAARNGAAAKPAATP